MFVSFEGRLGRLCCIQHPWPSDDTLVCFDMTARKPPHRVEYSLERVAAWREIRGETVAGHRYLLVRGEADLKTWKATRETPKRRDIPCMLEQTIFGRERLF